VEEWNTVQSVLLIGKLRDCAVYLWYSVRQNIPHRSHFVFTHNNRPNVLCLCVSYISILLTVEGALESS